jgi:predicted ArsR family transcriptional regulator
MQSPEGLPRRRIVENIKENGPSTLRELAERLGTTTEAVRLQIRQLEGAGLVEPLERAGEPGPGRPAYRYGLTRAGEHLFPKRYGDLATMLLDTVDRRLGSEAVLEVLAAAVEAKVASWRPRLAHCRSLPEQLEALKGIYVDDDPWVSVGVRDGKAVLIERNCPYLDVVQRRPSLCSLTVHTLTRLLGRRVERVRRFQDGDGRCEFVIHDEPVEPDVPLALEA